jgi:hypothetical protein
MVYLLEKGAHHGPKGVGVPRWVRKQTERPAEEIPAITLPVVALDEPQE